MSIQGNRDQRTISRRHLLGWAGMGAGGLAIAASRFSPSRALAKPFFAGDPFSLGVASGDPLPDGVVLWSRLAPEPLAEDGRAGCRLRPTGSATRWPRTRASRAYVADRRALVDLFADADGGAPTNPVVLTGDIHNNRIFDLKEDFSDSSSRTVGTEFVGTSISSGGDGPRERNGGQWTTVYNDPEGLNDHQKFYDTHRGYVRCTLTPGQWKADFRVIETTQSPTSPVSTVASFVVEDGEPGAKRA